MPNAGATRTIASFEVAIGGSRIPADAEADLILIEIADAVDEIGYFSLSFNAGDPLSGTVKWVDTDLLREGNEVVIRIGYEAPLSEMIVGEITAIEPEFPERGPIVLTVHGYDRLFRLGFGRKSRSFRDMTDGEIAMQIARDSGLTPDVEDTPVRHDYVLQNNQSDLEFLKERARRIRFEVRVVGRRLIFRRPGESSGKILSLTHGEGLLSFAPRLSVLPQATEVLVRGWSPKAKKEVRGRAGAGDETTRMGGVITGAQAVQRMVNRAALVLVEDAPATAEEADLIARGWFNEGAIRLVRGEARCLGETLLRAGAVVELLGLSRRFNGPYYISAARHTLRVRQGYATTISVMRSAA